MSNDCVLCPKSSSSVSSLWRHVNALHICRGIFSPLSFFFPSIRGCFAPYFFAIGLLILILSDLILLDQLVTLGSVMLL